MDSSSSTRLQILQRHLSPSSFDSVALDHQEFIAAQSCAARKPLATCAGTPANKQQFLHSPADYLRLDDLLAPAEKEIRYKVRHFMETEVRPIIASFNERAEFPRFILPKLAEIMHAGGVIKGHGCPGESLMHSAVIALEMARVDPSVSTLFMVHSDIAMASIGFCGSEEQKQKWLPKMSTMEWLGAFALTEPDIGSDASSLKCEAKKVPGGWLINGKKRWIGLAGLAKCVVTWARNTETGQVNGFIVENPSAGFKIVKIQHKVSQRALQNYDLSYDDVFVPDDNRLPLAENFQSGPARVLQMSRVLAAWGPVGASMGAYDVALKYVKERKQFGVPIASFQLVQEKLVRMLGMIQSMALVAWRVTRLFEEGKMTPGMSALAKSQNTLNARTVVALGREILGGNGIVDDYGVASLFTGVEAMYTYEGSYEINALIVGREVTGVSAFRSA